jgi:hypothetical protein
MMPSPTFNSKQETPKLADADINRPPRPYSRSDMHPRPGSTVIKVIQEHKFAVEETAEAEVPVVYEKVAAHDAAMTEIHIVVAIKIASNRVGTVEPAAINIALTVEECAAPALLIEERAALRPLGEVRAC